MQARSDPHRQGIAQVTDEDGFCNGGGEATGSLQTQYALCQCGLRNVPFLAAQKPCRGPSAGLG